MLCMIHINRYSSNYCKVLRYYGSKYKRQNPLNKSKCMKHDLDVHGYYLIMVLKKGVFPVLERGNREKEKYAAAVYYYL